MAKISVTSSAGRRTVSKINLNFKSHKESSEKATLFHRKLYKGQSENLKGLYSLPVKQPVNGQNECNVFSRKANCIQDHDHGDQSSLKLRNLLQIKVAQSGKVFLYQWVISALNHSVFRKYNCKRMGLFQFYISGFKNYPSYPEQQEFIKF